MYDGSAVFENLYYLPETGCAGCRDLKLDEAIVHTLTCRTQAMVKSFDGAQLLAFGRKKNEIGVIRNMGFEVRAVSTAFR